MASARSFSGVATNITLFAHLLAQLVLQGVVHEAWSIGLRTFEKGACLSKVMVLQSNMQFFFATGRKISSSVILYLLAIRREWKC
jgi:hypothetical protein